MEICDLANQYDKGTEMLGTFKFYPTNFLIFPVAISLCFVLVSCKNMYDVTDNSDLAEMGDVRLQDDQIVYDGYINNTNNKKVFDSIESAERRPTTLSITSKGGLIEHGLELGEWVFENKLDVVVPRYCLSSCANYVFTAGKKVILGKNAVIGWHRGPLALDFLVDTPLAEKFWQRWIKSIEKSKPEVDNPRQYIERILIRDRQFFRMIGVHRMITLLNWLLDENSVDNFADIDQDEDIFAFVSIEDMKYFGIENVFVENNQAWNPGNELLGDLLVKLTLDEDIEKHLSEIHLLIKNY